MTRFINGLVRARALTVTLILKFVALSVLALASLNITTAQTPGDSANDPFFNTLNQVGDCGNSYGFGSCTANDFRITSISLSNIVDSCVSSTDYFQADVTVEFSKATPIRYDVMAYFYRGEDDTGSPPTFNLATDAADTGTWCTRVGLQRNLTIFEPAPPAGVDSGLRTGDIDDEDKDGVFGNDITSFCYDAPNGSQNSTMTQTEPSMVLPCRDGNANGIVDIATCTGWANNAQGFCDGPQYDGLNEPQNGTGSKCNCGQFETVPAITIPNIAITKNCAGDGTGGTDAPDGSGNYAPGDVVQCTIVISNTGGTLDGAINATDEGFFYVDDYDESNGSIGTIAVVNSSGSVNETFNDTSTQLNVYPDDILNGGNVTITYLYTIDQSASFNQVSEDIPNEVCTYYYDSTNMTATLNSNFCADDTITTTPVTLAEFNAVRMGNRVAFDWATASETNNLGFNVYAQFGASRIKLNDQLIPSQAVNSLEPLDYSFSVSRNDVAGAQKFYLEDIDLEGKSTFAGPFELQSKRVAKAFRAPKTDWRGIAQRADRDAKGLKKGLLKRAKRGEKQSDTRTAKSSTVAPVIALSVEASGLVSVNARSIVDLGWTYQALRQGAYTITNAFGDEVASRFVREGGKRGKLEFVAEVERTFYGEANTYLLKPAAKGSAQAMLASSSFAAASGDNLAYYMETARTALDALYHLGSTVENDPWMMQRMIAFGTTPSVATVNVELNNPATTSGANAIVMAEMLGGFDPEGRQDRIFGMSVGDNAFLSQPGGGLKTNRLTGSLPASELGDTVPVSVSVLQTNDFGIDLSYLNGVSVNYPRNFVAINNQLQFSSNNSQFSVSGFTSNSVEAFAFMADGTVALGQLPVRGGRVEFSGVAGAQSYALFGSAAIQTPVLEAVAPAKAADFSGKDLVIAHPLFANAELDDYLSWRDSTLGTQSAVVNVDDIYCAYSGCEVNAGAIKQFINDVDAPASVMLVGGDVYDYHNNLSVGAISFVPTLYARTGDLIGFAPVDALFGDRDEDGVPEVAVGRLPVRSSAELSAVIAKSKKFGTQQGRVDAVLTADEQTSTSAYNFSNSSELVADVLADKGWTVNRQHLDDYLSPGSSGATRNAELAAARSGVFAALDQGPRLSVYTGHSSAVSWSFANLFNYAATQALTNDDSPSLYLQWGCYNTYYSHPTTESMSHGLLLSGEQGAAVVVGASSLTNAAVEEQFAQLIQERLVASDQSVGAAMIDAKQALADANGAGDIDILWSVTLLGDPQLRL